MVKVPKTIQKYLEDESTVPLIDVKGTLWYYITQREKDMLKKFVDEIDRIPESTWRTWSEDVALQYSHWANLADRIVRNSKIRETK